MVSALAPANGKVIAQIAACGDVDVDRAVTAARTAFESGRWSSLAPAARKSVLMDFADLIEANTDELALLESLDAGKPITDCRNFDFPDVVHTIRWYAEAADSNLNEIVLECGGKSPQIVTGDCANRIDLVASDLAEAAFWNAGQNCSAGTRILVHNSIKTELVQALAEQAGTRTVGDPSNESTTMGPLIEADALDRVLGYIDGATAAGATAASGGTRLLAETGGWYVAPTVLSDVAPDMPVAREEIFGPIVAVLGFDHEEQALYLANDTEYGLAATIWSKDIDVALRMARGVRAGTVAVNGYSEGDITTPFGGFRMSGFGGRDNGLEALEQYTALKTIWVTVR